MYSHRWGYQDGSDSKESACNAEDLGSVPGAGNYYPLQYSCLRKTETNGSGCVPIKLCL